MDVLWQHNDPANPSDSVNGLQAYDHHLYYKLVRKPSTLRCRTWADVSLLAAALVYVYINRNSFRAFLRISYTGCRRQQSGSLLARPLQCVPHSESFYLFSRSDDLLSQIEMILREMPSRCWRTPPSGLASGLFPRSSPQRTSSYANGQTRRNSSIVKVMDGWYVLPPFNYLFLISQTNKTLTTA
jgi:hypothetical protein